MGNSKWTIQKTWQ